jgi:hypothetical protein
MKKKLTEFLKKFADIDFENLSQNTWRIAVNCGKSRIEQKQLSYEDWSLLDDLADSLWDSNNSIEWKIRVGFEFYEMFPSYYHALKPYYYFIRDKRITNVDIKEEIWERFAQYLSSQAEHRDPVQYVLWVNFFEDTSTVEESWVGMWKACQKYGVTSSLLPISGPVPWELKVENYWQEAQNITQHAIIIKALIASAYDVYGKIKWAEAWDLVIHLQIDKQSNEYRALEKKYNEAKSG